MAASTEHRAWIDLGVIDKSKAASDHTTSSYRLVEVEDTVVQQMLKHAATSSGGSKRSRNTEEDEEVGGENGKKTLCFQFKGDGKEIVVVGGGERAVGVRRIEYSNSLFLIDKAHHVPSETDDPKQACVVVNEAYTFELHPTRSKVESIRSIMPFTLAISPSEGEALLAAADDDGGGSSRPRFVSATRAHMASPTFTELVEQSMCSKQEVAEFLTAQGALMVTEAEAVQKGSDEGEVMRTNSRVMTKPRIPQRMWFLQVLDAVLVLWNGRREERGSDDNDEAEDAGVDRDLIKAELESAFPAPLIDAVVIALAQKKEGSQVVSFKPTSSMTGALAEHLFVLAALVASLTSVEDVDSEAANECAAAMHYVAPLTQLTVQALQVLQATYNTIPIPPLVNARECIDRHIHAAATLLPGFGAPPPPGQNLITIELPLSAFLSHYRRHIREKCGRTWLLTSTTATESTATAKEPGQQQQQQEVTELTDDDILDTWLGGFVYVKESGPTSTIGFLEEWRLPARLTGRVAVMFAIKPKWRLWELRAYLRPVLDEGQTIDWAIGKYCKENRLSTGKWQEYTRA